MAATPSPAQTLISASHLAQPLEPWLQRLAQPEGRLPPRPVGARDPGPTPAPGDRVLEDFRPLTRSLEWRISGAYWRQRGVLPFAEREVPFIVNNNGRMSDNAALVLFANCREAPPAGRLTVVELGAGSGLFARHFLDCFKALCAQHKRDFYDRLDLVVTDHSPATVRHWTELGLFDGHPGRVRTVVADAADGPPVDAPVRAAFCNYVLDVLPAANVRRGADGRPDQLCVRTRLVDDPALVAKYTSLALPELRQLAASDSDQDLAALFPLLTLLEQEVAFRGDGASAIPGVTEALAPPTAEAAGAADAGGSVRIAYGALQCLERTAARLEPDGFVLINDYGWTRPERSRSSCERFGPTVALGLDFPHLERELRRRALVVTAPGGDVPGALHSRLVTRRPLPGTARLFDGRFNATAAEHFEGPVKAARAHRQAGRLREAYASYKLAMERSPRDWSLLSEVAELCAYRMRCYPAAVLLARAALALNPYYSARIWNVLGSALYQLRRFDEAHQALLQAERIDPRGARTSLNMAVMFLLLGDFAAALRSIARGLELANDSGQQQRLLAVQQAALRGLTARASGEQRRLAERRQHFSPRAVRPARPDPA